MLEAATAVQALALAAACDFQVLITDSVETRPAERTLAEIIEEIRPGQGLVYMSDDAQSRRLPRACHRNRRDGSRNPSTARPCSTR